MPLGKASERSQGHVGECQVVGLGSVLTLVEHEVNMLAEAAWADTTLEGPHPRMQSHVGLEVAGAAETLVAYLMGKSMGSAWSTLPSQLPRPILLSWKHPSNFPSPCRLCPQSVACPASGALESGQLGCVSCFFDSLCELYW